MSRTMGIRPAALAAMLLVGSSLAHANSAPSTFSIVAYDSVTQELGVAVQSKYFAVGGVVPGGLGLLWLIAVRPDCAGRGLAKPLLLAFLLASRRHFDHVEIGTQSDNVPANRLYQSVGLKLVANAVTLHRWF